MPATCFLHNTDISVNNSFTSMFLCYFWSILSCIFREVVSVIVIIP